ncbi:MAG: hypothetical protein CHACPFDD_00041 [Phycisphaerae bacterium]|nr:hypothetical protein [Phycisphaerae bacterium]
MPRLTVVDPSTATGKVKEIFDGPLKGKHLNIFRGLANSPAALQGYLGISGALKEGLLSAKEREVIALTLAEMNQCAYCLAAHTAIGKGAGMSEQDTIDARKGKLGDPKTAALRQFVITLHEKKGFVGDDALKTFRAAGFSDGHVAEVIANYALNIYTNYFNHVNDTTVDFPAAPKLS